MVLVCKAKVNNRTDLPIVFEVLLFDENPQAVAYSAQPLGWSG